MSHSFTEVRIMPYKAELIDAIIMDIEKYPQFLPWCSFAKILSREEDYLTTSLEIRFKGFSEGYISKVSRQENAEGYIIETLGISGPFKYLKNTWQIKRLDNSSEVSFFIDFKFKSQILEMVISGVFSAATRKIISAFEDRVKELSR